MGFLQALFGNYSVKELKKLEPIKQKVLSFEEEYKALSDAQLKQKTEEFKSRLLAGETLDDILPEAFAVCREGADRVLNMRHFPVQILGGIVLHQGRISEMRTGEGKTLVATLPAYLNALSGKGVHIVTVNDYLARRDSEWMGKLYRFLGLSVGLIVHDMSNEERREAYNADITYCTNNELGFDYLRDNMVKYKEHKVQRGHNFAIVDEVDSILIDEARTPLIISGTGDKSSEIYTLANNFAKSLKAIRVTESDSKTNDEDLNLDGDYVVDEKAKSVTLTPDGVKKAEAFFKIDNLNDAENITISHHVNQAIRAHGIMKRDVDYVVKDGEVIIVDEFTGRLMFGRRYSDGLHQAIEAKEHVNVANESKTLATITFQNFFRLYDKLSGMTGTAVTEEEEFRAIYKLDVIEIPTNKPLIREDMPDVLYKTERAKYFAVIEQIIKAHEIGQPVLVGTVTIEKSELLSAMLKKRGIKHNVLNAKHHEKEAEIIAQAGKLGAVTIATNMAGRGTDIMLGGNAEYLAKAALRHDGMSDELISLATGFAETDDSEILNARKLYTDYYNKFKAEIAPEAEQVKNAGGLLIIGTERHESRRIDNQLRGRAGRQGDAGKTVFYLSAEDDLLRLFAGERFYNILETFKVDETMPLQNPMLSKAIESSQQKVESRNFAARKSVLDFDDVLNQQRDVIYSQRNKVLDGESLRDTVIKMINDTIDSAVATYLNDAEVHDNWNVDGLRRYFSGWICSENDLRFTVDELSELDEKDVADLLKQKAQKIYAEREERFGSELMRELERFVLLTCVDTSWQDHIDAMDDLRQGIHLRSYGQHDPVVAYRNESYDMFESMTDAIKEKTAKNILTVQLVNKSLDRGEAKKGTENLSGNAPKKSRSGISKNALCPCGSGKKYKRCCGKDEA